MLFIVIGPFENRATRKRPQLPQQLRLQNYWGFKSFHHPLFSRLSSIGLILIYRNKIHCGDRKIYYLNKEVITETNSYFTDLDKFYYPQRINKLEQQCTKCTSLKEDCVKNNLSNDIKL